MTTDTDYKTWREATDIIARRGDIAEYVIWLATNPSPLLKRGVFSNEEPLPSQVLHRAFYDTAVRFKGASVRIDATDEPEASARLVWRIEGTLRGVGSMCAEGNGVGDTDIIVVETQQGHFQTVRISRVVGMENGR